MFNVVVVDVLHESEPKGESGVCYFIDYCDLLTDCSAFI